MTSIEYAYTERDIYTAIVQTAVPIALTADETALLVADLIALAAEMPHDTPAAVWHEYRRQHGAYPSTAYRRNGYADNVPASWYRKHIDRLSAFARQAAEYPSLKGGV